MKILKKLFSGSMVCYCLCSYAQTADTSQVPLQAPFDCYRPDGYAPLGVMTDHMYFKNQWMVSYTYMDMLMSGNRSGTSKISDDEIFQNYYASPEKMSAQMNMLTVIYGFTDRINFMAVFNANSNSVSMNMDPTMQTHMAEGTPTSLTTKTFGLGDTKLYAFYKWADQQHAQVVVGLGGSFPTGNIQQKGLNVAGDTSRLSYNMQLGTGTWGILPSIAYIGQSHSLSWGGSASANVILFANADGYQWGNQYKGTAWLAYKWCNYISNSIRAEGIYSGSIKGYDESIAAFANNDPTANTANYGGIYGTVYLGLNLYIPKIPHKDLRLAFEYGIPVYQNLDGIQMSMQSGFLGSLQYGF